MGGRKVEQTVSDLADVKVASVAVLMVVSLVSSWVASTAVSKVVLKAVLKAQVLEILSLR